GCQYQTWGFYHGSPRSGNSFFIYDWGGNSYCFINIPGCSVPPGGGAGCTISNCFFEWEQMFTDHWETEMVTQTHTEYTADPYGQHCSASGVQGWLVCGGHIFADLFQHSVLSGPPWTTWEHYPEVHRPMAEHMQMGYAPC